MTLFESIQTCYDKYATFCGRASRSEFWWAVSFFTVVYILIRFGMRLFLVSSSACMLAYFWSVICFLPLVSVAVRRLHDVGHTGWWLIGTTFAYIVVMIVVIDVVMLWNASTFVEAIEEAKLPCCIVSVATAIYFVYTMSKAEVPFDSDEI